jgi:RNA polymerase sigma-70 factor (ECF subfamily)
MMRKIGRFLPAPLENHADERERISSAEPGIEAVLVMQDRRRILHEALQTLPFKEKTALVLRDIEGLSTEETAHILGSTAATVRSQVASARIRIRRYCDRRLRRKK